jgi:ABC-type multidrug transport system fused ATPase/permease subunit
VGLVSSRDRRLSSGKSMSAPVSSEIPPSTTEADPAAAPQETQTPPVFAMEGSVAAETENSTSATSVKNGSLGKRLKHYRQASMLRPKMKRQDHFRRLLLKHRIRAALERKPGKAATESGTESDLDLDEAPSSTSSAENSLYYEVKAEVQAEMDTADSTGKVKEAYVMSKDYYRYAKKGVRNLSLEVRMENFTYSVPISSEAGKVKTVYNSSSLYQIEKFFQRMWRGEKKKPARIGTKKVLDDINLVLRPGKAYLLLGPPTSGKTTLLRAITGNLHPGKEDSLDGTIKYNGRALKVCQRHLQHICYTSVISYFAHVNSHYFC